MYSKGQERKFILYDLQKYGTQAHLQGIRLDDEGKVKVWVSDDGHSGEGLLQGLECLLRLVGPVHFVRLTLFGEV